MSADPFPGGPVPADPGVRRRVKGPLAAGGAAYALSNADRPGVVVPVSGALVRSMLTAVLHGGGAATLEPGTGALILSWPSHTPTAPTTGVSGVPSPGVPGAPGLLGPVYRAEPRERPAHTPCCARCGHWPGEHHLAAPSACTRYRLYISPPRRTAPARDGVTYTWTRRLGHTRVRFDITEPTTAFPGGALAVRRFPAPGDGPYDYSAHYLPIPPDRRTALLQHARTRVEHNRPRTPPHH